MPSWPRSPTGSCARSRTGRASPTSPARSPWRRRSSRSTFDRQKIADLGLEVDRVGRTLESFLAGRTVTRFNRNAEQYDVMVQVADADRKEPDDLAAIHVRGRGGEMIQLSNLVELRETVAAKELTRFNQLRSATVIAALGTRLHRGPGARAFRGGRARGAARQLPLRLFRARRASSSRPAARSC